MSYGSINNTRDVKVKNINGDLAFNVDTLELEGSLANTLKFWEMKGLTITDIENNFNFDFVITSDCVPVVSNGRFVIVRR